MQPSITTILSRWIPQAGKTVAERLAAIMLGRFKTPPRHVSFEVQRYAGTDPEVGGGYQFSCAFVQDETGASDGTSEAGGTGGSGISGGGNGGGPGLAGSASGKAGGAAGSAIDGVSYASIIGTGDIRGSQIN